MDNNSSTKIGFKSKLKSKLSFTKADVKQWFISLILIWLGCCLSAFANVGIMLPNGLATSGVVGIARMLQYSLNFNLSITTYILSAVVVVVTWVTLGFKEVRKLIAASILFPLTLILFEQIDFSLLAQKDLILASVFYGVLNGLGNAILFYRGYTFGGMDTIAKIFRKKLFPHYSQSSILMGLNILVLSGCFFIFGKNITLYAMIAQWVSGEIMDLALHGFQGSFVQVEIITDKGDDVCNYIINDMNRGVSVHEVEGGFTGNIRKELRLICSRREEIELIKNLKKIDPVAFVTVIKLDNIHGKGFQPLNLDD